MSRTPRAIQTPGDVAAPDEVVTVAAEVAPEVSTGTDYSKLHSTEVDAKTLKRSVLCKDGWVCPDFPPQPAQRA